MKDLKDQIKEKDEAVDKRIDKYSRMFEEVIQMVKEIKEKDAESSFHDHYSQSWYQRIWL